MDNVKYLGLIIDSNLTWDRHISNMCKSIAPKLALLRHNLNKLQRLQDLAARIIEGCYDYIDARLLVLLGKLGWTDLNSRRQFLLACLMFKCINNLVPNYLTDQVVFAKDVQIRDLRTNSNNLLVPRPRLEKFKESIFYRGSILWNDLNTDLHECNLSDCIRQLGRHHVDHNFPEQVTETWES